jgi:hypothetical protein
MLGTLAFVKNIIGIAFGLDHLAALSGSIAIEHF